jgi:hypothetical protein
LRREYSRRGWFIFSGGNIWDNWAYPSEAAAHTTVERCKVPDATVVPSSRQGFIDNRGRQHSQKLLTYRKR